MKLFYDYFTAREELMRYFNCDTMYNNTHSIYINEFYHWKLDDYKIHVAPEYNDVIDGNSCTTFTAFGQEWVYEGDEFTIVHLRTGNSGVFEIYNNSLRVY